MLRLIKNEEQYEEALEQIYVLMQENILPDSADEVNLEILTLLVKEYEKEHYPITPPNPIEAIKFRLEQMGLKESELSKILGNRSRKSDILNGNRKLSLSMIRTLHKKLNIPAEILISEY
ncbi:MAG: transcriptional regulator [Spirosomaceae bacterium]|jgi:HTH-type transcriptional regulator/antitoxin HigA|nr:transcriptional regulator [Spirosomataceae bacterium]